MKTLRILSFILCTALCSSLYAAKSDVEQAIKALTTHPKVTCTHNASYDRSPVGTGLSKCVKETYQFELKKKYKSLIDNIESALLGEKDNPACYRIELYQATPTGSPRPWNILYGDNDSQYIEVGRDKQASYVFINYLEDSVAGYGKFRTCYGIEWRYKNAKTIVGQVFITYAKIPNLTGQQQRTGGDPFNWFDFGERGMNFDSDTTMIDLDLTNLGSFFGGNLSSAIDPILFIPAIRAEFADSDPDERMTLSAILYNSIKTAVARKPYTNDEAEMLTKHLKEMIAECESAMGDDHSENMYLKSTIDYLNLTIKLLKNDPTP